MTNIELYINKTLCDIQSPEKLGVRLNRVLINPAELNTKDAQYSYSITIPASSANDAIFGYANVEEVKNKFNRPYTAQLYVDSIRIFDGQFKLSEIDSDGNYKGNLVVPAKKTIKEIFGEKKMTEIDGEWELKVNDPLNPNKPLGMVEMLNKFNTDKGTPKCIFPLVLYGLLPKLPKDEAGTYTGKTLWDKYVRLGIEDFPPSINCMEAIRTIFENHKYTIGGNAFNDARLMNLYMSYQNPTDYNQEWNWGHLGHFKIKGSWTNYKKNADNTSHYERFGFKNDDDGQGSNFYAANLFRSSMVDIKELEDDGTNVFRHTSETAKGDCKNINITIPQSGLYKIRLDTTLKVRTDLDRTFFGNVFQYIGTQNRPAFRKNLKRNDFSNSRYEVKLLRDFGEGEFDIEDSKFDGVLYRDNLPQDNDNKKTRYFPIPGGTPDQNPDGNCVQMIDPLQNAKFVSGFRWGDYGKSSNLGGILGHSLLKSDCNPLEKILNTPDKYKYCRIMAIKHGWSWDVKFSQKNKIYSAINSPGYNRIVGTDPDLEEEVLPAADKSVTPFKVELEGVTNNIENSNNLIGTGNLNQVVWLEKGEHLTLVTVSSSGHDGEEEGWMIHDIDFTLEVEPFKKNYEWITVDNKGTGTQKMNWNDSSDFKKDYINLIKFLPSDKKIDEWLDNFCKAFNLQLSQPEDGKFELNVKQSTPAASAASLLDLDGKASITHRTNEPLGLPSEFKLGFKVNLEEQGLVEYPGEDGGGSFFTGNLDGGVVSQSSNFSYNWYKDIVQEKEILVEVHIGLGIPIWIPITTKQTLKLPVITHNEIWKLDDTKDYAEMQKKLYTNYAQRFWYKSRELDNVGGIWDNKAEIELPQLRNYLEDGSSDLNLHYKDNPSSILSTYFSIIATDDSNYTYVECYLTPDEYEQLDGNKLVKLNGDLYYISAIEGYDPIGRNKAKLKLIRKV